MPETDLTQLLGRRANHDERNRAYPARALFGAGNIADLPSVRHRRHVSVYDQGTQGPGGTGLGSCVANAVCGALSTGPGTSRVRSPRYIVGVYSWLTAHDPFDGAYPSEDTGSDGTTAGAWAKATGRAAEYRHGFTLEEAVAALQRFPLLFGIGWPVGFFTPAPSGELTPGGSIAGGHEVIIDGYDAERRRVWLQNSWSASWSLDGRAWMSLDVFDALRRDQGDITILVPKD